MEQSGIVGRPPSHKLSLVLKHKRRLFDSFSSAAEQRLLVLACLFPLFNEAVYDPDQVKIFVTDDDENHSPHIQQLLDRCSLPFDQLLHSPLVQFLAERKHRHREFMVYLAVYAALSPEFQNIMDLSLKNLSLAQANLKQYAKDNGFALDSATQLPLPSILLYPPRASYPPSLPYHVTDRNQDDLIDAFTELLPPDFPNVVKTIPCEKKFSQNATIRHVFHISKSMKEILKIKGEGSCSAHNFHDKIRYMKDILQLPHFAIFLYHLFMWMHEHRLSEVIAQTILREYHIENFFRQLADLLAQSMEVFSTGCLFASCLLSRCLADFVFLPCWFSYH